MTTELSNLPPSAIYVRDYVDGDAALQLLATVDAAPWQSDLRRRVQHYGYRYDYTARRVTRDSYLGPLPGWLQDLADRLLAEEIFPSRPDQVIVNEYLPGQGIAPHIDCEPCFGDVVASLSLGSCCMMNFAHVRSGEKLAHYLEPAGLLVLKAESRFDWTHGIPARKSDKIGGAVAKRGRRVSLTFRTVISTA